MASTTQTVRDGNLYQQSIRDRIEAAQPSRVRDPKARAAWFDVFSENGEDYVYECIANGVPPVGVAQHHGWPKSLFVEWWRTVTDPQREMEARKAAADLAALHQDLIYDDPNASATPAAASNARSRAEAKRWLAERQNPDRWGPPQASIPEQGKVIINLSVDGQNAPAEYIVEQTRKREKKLLDAPKVFSPKALDHDAEDA